MANNRVLQGAGQITRLSVPVGVMGVMDMGVAMNAAKIPLFCICSVGSVGDQLFTFTIMPLAEDEATRSGAHGHSRTGRDKSGQ